MFLKRTINRHRANNRLNVGNILLFTLFTGEGRVTETKKKQT